MPLNPISNHLIEMVLSMLCETGDPVLCEEFTYSNILEVTETKTRTFRQHCIIESP